MRPPDVPPPYRRESVGPLPEYVAARARARQQRAEVLEESKQPESPPSSVSRRPTPRLRRPGLRALGARLGGPLTGVVKATPWPVVASLAAVVVFALGWFGHAGWTRSEAWERAAASCEALSTYSADSSRSRSRVRSRGWTRRVVDWDQWELCMRGKGLASRR